MGGHREGWDWDHPTGTCESCGEIWPCNAERQLIWCRRCGVRSNQAALGELCPATAEGTDPYRDRLHDFSRVNPRGWKISNSVVTVDYDTGEVVCGLCGALGVHPVLACMTEQHRREEERAVWSRWAAEQRARRR